MLSRQIITEENREFCSFGLHQAMVTLFSAVSVLLVGWCLGMAWQALVYLLCYMPIRVYAGGYHARTQWRCYIFSCLMMAIVLLGIRYLGKYVFVYAGFTVAAGLILFLLAPVEDENKPLDELEVRVYRKKAYVAAGIELGICAICFIWQTSLFLCVGSAVIGNGAIVLLGWMRNQIRKRSGQTADA